MWWNTYKDYRVDEKWIENQVEPGAGIVGCEMHEINGWGLTHHYTPPRKKGPIRLLLNAVFKKHESSS